MAELLVTVATFYSAVEAMVARSSLEAAGIRCSLPDQPGKAPHSFTPFSTGRMRLQVAPSDEAAARRILGPDESSVD